MGEQAQQANSHAHLDTGVRPDVQTLGTQIYE
jgi:hypothetical protein